MHYAGNLMIIKDEVRMITTTLLNTFIFQTWLKIIIIGINKASISIIIERVSTTGAHFTSESVKNLIHYK